MNIQRARRISQVKPYYFATKLAEIAQRNNDGANIINLGIGSPDLLPPEDVLLQLQKSSTDKTANKYQSYSGIPVLREAFANHYQSNFTVSIDPNVEVLPLIGSKEGIMHISMAYLDEGDEALVPNPGYPSYTSATKLSGGTPRYYDLTAEGGWLPDLQHLASQDLSKVKIMWINYPHMPTGAKIRLSQLQDIVNFTQEHNILLCHDNPYCYIQNKNPLSIFNCTNAKDNCVELFSLSKSYNMAGWRVGAMIGDSEFIKAAMTFKSNMDSGMYRPVQEAAATALGHTDDWFSNLNVQYSERKIIAYQILDHLYCSYDTDQAGMFVWARIPDSIQDVSNWIDQIIDEAEVFLTPGFIFGTNGDRYIRISLCSDIPTLQESLTRIRSKIKL